MQESESPMETVVERADEYGAPKICSSEMAA